MAVKWYLILAYQFLHQLIDSNIIIDILWAFCSWIYILKLICHIINLISFYLYPIHMYIIIMLFLSFFVLFLLLVAQDLCYRNSSVLINLLSFSLFPYSICMSYAFAQQKITHVPDMAWYVHAHKLKNKLKIN